MPSTFGIEVLSFGGSCTRSLLALYVLANKGTTILRYSGNHSTRCNDPEGFYLQ